MMVCIIDVSKKIMSIHIADMNCLGVPQAHSAVSIQYIVMFNLIDVMVDKSLIIWLTPVACFGSLIPIVALCSMKNTALEVEIIEISRNLTKPHKGLGKVWP
jgi:hypothetical protein